MQARQIFLSLIVSACATLPATAADDLDSLKGQYTFDWHSDPDKVKCTVIDDKLLSVLKSDAFDCKMDVITNTASDQPARICTKKEGDGEYMIFSSQKSCELERETQAANGD